MDKDLWPSLYFGPVNLWTIGTAPAAQSVHSAIPRDRKELVENREVLLADAPDPPTSDI
jgi:hypothetical protein